MARKNRPIYVNSYSPTRGELLAATFELWIRAINLLDRHLEAESLRALHDRTFRALLLDDLLTLPVQAIAAMAGAIVDGLDAHRAAHHITAPARVMNARRSLADANRYRGRRGYGATYAMEVSFALRCAVDELADAVLRENLPLDTALDLTDRDRYDVRATQEAAA